MSLKILIISIFSILLASAVVLIKSDRVNLSQISTVFPNEQIASLPDLAPLAIYDLRLSKLNGRSILKFSASFVNKGKAQFELIGDPNVRGDKLRDVYQRIARDNGSFEDTVVGKFEWHGVHDHYHYGDFAEYVFGPVRLALSNSKAPLAIRQKVTFCLRDNKLEMPDLQGAPKNKVFANCTQDRQGVSVGWTDVYDYTLPDQYIDVHDMPAGIYQLSFFLDSNQLFIEESKDNNISTVFFELNPAKNLVKPIAATAPFFTYRNNFPDQFLAKGEGAEVYVIHNNKKRWVKTIDIFNSYSYSWNNVYNLTQSTIDAIPFNNLVRVWGHQEVYALNDLGYKRHILNPEVFYSYQFTGPDVAGINETEFAGYPYSNLIRLGGDGDIYLIIGTSTEFLDPLKQGQETTPRKKKLGKLDYVQSLGYDPNAIQTVNQIDFESYFTLP